jgi:hypothetical protein
VKKGEWDFMEIGEKEVQICLKQRLQCRRVGSTLCALFGKTPRVCGMFAASLKRLIYVS